MKSDATQLNKSTEMSGKELIIWKAYQVFREKGYHHTTMADLGEACGLLKGSIYHYFSSKEDLMKQVLQTAHLKFREEVFSIPFQTTLPAKEGLQYLLKIMNVYFFDGPGGCLMGNIGLETASQNTSFTIVIQNFFEEWIEVFTHVFQTQYSPSEAKEIARQAVGEMQGSLMLSCIFKDKTYFSSSCQKISTLLT